MERIERLAEKVIEKLLIAGIIWLLARLI